jgi:hypothetical protein
VAYSLLLSLRQRKQPTQTAPTKGHHQTERFNPYDNDNHPPAQRCSDEIVRWSSLENKTRAPPGVCGVRRIFPLNKQIKNKSNE